MGSAKVHNLHDNDHTPRDTCSYRLFGILCPFPRAPSPTCLQIERMMVGEDN